MTKKINIKEALNLVDVILDGNYKVFKKLQHVDEILDEVENKIDTNTNQNIPELINDVKNEISKDELQKNTVDDVDDNEIQVENMMKEAVQKLVNEEDYRDFFKLMLDKWNIKNPMELPEDKRKKFFNQVSQQWKKEKGE